MAETDAYPPNACGEHLRRLVARRRRRRRVIAIVVATLAIIVPVLATLAWRMRPMLVWNVSASMRRGLYAIIRAPLRRNDIAVARLPAGAAQLAASRHYLPIGIPVVKRAAALGGDRICGKGGLVSINGKVAVMRRASDAYGRALPQWFGCRTLGRTEYLLLGDSPSSFDGRYFGPTKAYEIIGRGTLLWAR